MGEGIWDLWDTQPTMTPLCLFLHTCVTAMHPDTLPVVLALAPHHVVGEVRLGHLVLGVHNHLERARGRAGGTTTVHAPWGAEQHPKVQGEGYW